VRAGLVPALEAVHPAAQANVVRTAELLRDEAEVLDAVVETALEDLGDGVRARVEDGVLRMIPTPPLPVRRLG